MRNIALLEFKPNTAVKVVPPAAYLKGTNGTLAPLEASLLIDDDGFMVTSREKCLDDRSLLLLGGSCVENLFIPEGERILAKIEQKLGDVNKSTKVYSAGISHAHLLHFYNIILNKGIKKRPYAIICFLAPWPEVFAARIADGYWSKNQKVSTLHEEGRAPNYWDPNNNPLTVDFSDHLNLWLSLKALCDNFRIKLIITTWPGYGSYDAFIQANETVEIDKFNDEEKHIKMLNEAIRNMCT